MCNQLIRLKELTSEMVVPKARLTDVSWLARNLVIQNRNHKNFKEVISILKQLHSRLILE